MATLPAYRRRGLGAAVDGGARGRRARARRRHGVPLGCGRGRGPDVRVRGLPARRHRRRSRAGARLELPPPEHAPPAQEDPRGEAEERQRDERAEHRHRHREQRHAQRSSRPPRRRAPGLPSPSVVADDVSRVAPVRSSGSRSRPRRRATTASVQCRKGSTSTTEEAISTAPAHARGLPGEGVERVVEEGHEVGRDLERRRRRASRPSAAGLSSDSKPPASSRWPLSAAALSTASGTNSRRPAAALRPTPTRTPMSVSLPTRSMRTPSRSAPAGTGACSIVPRRPASKREERRMATKKDFTEEEWETLRRGATGAGMMVSISDRSFFDSFKEAGALARHLGKARKGGDSELVRELSEGRGTGFGVTDSADEVERETLGRSAHRVEAAAGEGPGRAGELPRLRAGAGALGRRGGRRRRRGGACDGGRRSARRWKKRRTSLKRLGCGAAWPAARRSGPRPGDRRPPVGAVRSRPAPTPAALLRRHGGRRRCARRRCARGRDARAVRGSFRPTPSAATSTSCVPYPAPSAATERQRARAVRLLARIRSATRLWPTSADAERAGFATTPARRRPRRLVVAYLHAEHRRNSNDRRYLDPLRPEALDLRERPRPAAHPRRRRCSACRAASSGRRRAGRSRAGTRTRSACAGSGAA